VSLLREYLGRWRESKIFQGGDVELFIWLSLIGTPTALGFAWRFWFRETRRQISPKWQAVMLFLGLLGASVNVTMYYSWLTYRLVAGDTPPVWKLQETLSNISDYPLSLAAAGAFLGREDARTPLAFCAFLGWMLWWRYGVL
jgi:hypothetical protein